jgi:hypothetical protein
VQDHSSSTYASISFRPILNQVVKRVRVDYCGGKPFFTNNWKSQAILALYKPAEPEAPLFDVWSAICDTPPEEEESAVVRALAYFEGVLGWRIGDINHISYLQARAAQKHYACMDQALYRTRLCELVLIS